MASTSGTINVVTVTGTTIVTDALEDLRVLLDGASPTAGDLTKGQRKLNFLIKFWATKGLLLWCRDTIQIPLVTNQFVYTIGPGGDVNTYRPLRALEGSFIRTTCAPAPFDIQLILLSRLEYMQQSYKSAVGVPNSFYYDPQMAPGPLTAYDPSLSKGVLRIWTAPSDLTRTIFLEVQRPIQDIGNLSETFDLPLEWYYALTLNLGAAMGDAYEIPEARLTRVKNEARAALAEISDWGATEQAPITFQPDFSGQRH
jgi:hypothetical protein